MANRKRKTPKKQVKPSKRVIAQVMRRMFCNLCGVVGPTWAPGVCETCANPVLVEHDVLEPAA